MKVTKVKKPMGRDLNPVASLKLDKKTNCYSFVSDYDVYLPVGSTRLVKVAERIKTAANEVAFVSGNPDNGLNILPMIIPPSTTIDICLSLANYTMGQIMIKKGESYGKLFSIPISGKIVTETEDSKDEK